MSQRGCAGKQASRSWKRKNDDNSFLLHRNCNQQHSYIIHVLPSTTTSKPANKQHSAEKHMQSPRVPHSNDSLDLGPWRNQGESSGYFLALHTPPPSLPPSLPPFTPHPHTHTPLSYSSLYYSKRKRKNCFSPPLPFTSEGLTSGPQTHTSAASHCHIFTFPTLIRVPGRTSLPSPPFRNPKEAPKRP